MLTCHLCRLLFHVVRAPDGIYNASLGDGGSAQRISLSNLNSPFGITVNSNTQRMCWTQSGKYRKYTV